MIRILILLVSGLVLVGCKTSDPSVGQAQVLASASSASAALLATEAKQLFGNEHDASRQSPDPFGSYAKGCLAGAAQLPETGPTWQAMRLSRNRNWGHPATIGFLQRLSQKAVQIGWNGLYVGDISQPRGGPMLTGHRSHQIGLDADIWLRPGGDMTMSVAERESFEPISMRRAKGAYTNDNWTAAHHQVIRAAAMDPAVARIFIFPGAKARMCREETGDRDWLRKVRPWWGHHYHFHVRLACPDGAVGCVDQAPPPPGDGCAEADTWVQNILNPPPPDPNAPPPKPRRELTLADLPSQCAQLLSVQ